MTDPTNPGDIPDPGAVPPPPPPAAAPPPPPPPAAPSGGFPPPDATGGFPPPAGGTGFPPPTEPVPVAGAPLGPPPGPPASKGKGPLIAIVAVVALILGGLGFVALGGDDDDKQDVSADTTTTEDDGTTTTTEKDDGPGGKEGTADEGDKEDEQTDTTSSGDAEGYGDDPTLDALWDQCEAGDFEACDTLYMDSGFGTEYEEFGDTCGNRNEPQGYCVDVYSDDGGTDSIDGTGAMNYGDDVQLDALYDQCEAGDFQACDTLYMESDFGSEYEEFGDTCGDRNEPQGYCVDVYSDDGGD